MNDRFKANNFDLLRFLFASTVMLVHAHLLSGQRQLAPLSEWLSSEIAYKGFFVVSGLLVFMSYEKSGSLAVYAEKRARRIYPAYFTVVTGGALILFLISSAPAPEYFRAGFAKYLAANLTFLNFIHPVLPGVFEGNLLREVNGALWTLKIEVMFYVTVPIFAWMFERFGRLRVLATTSLLSVLYYWVFEWLARKTGSNIYIVLGRQLPGQLSYFMMGAFFYYYFRFFEKHATWFAAGAGVLFVVHRFLPVDPFEPLWLGTLVAFFGFFLYAGNFGRYGDFSYGIYILHFPILQAMIYSGLFAWSPLLALMLACMAVLAAAALMWHMVEKRFLARSSHYVAATENSDVPFISSPTRSIPVRNSAIAETPGTSQQVLRDGDARES